MVRALYPDDCRLVSRLGTNQWHQLNDFALAEATFRRCINQQYERADSVRYSLGMMLLGQERYDDAIEQFSRARAVGRTGPGEMYARAFDARRDHARADAIYRASTNGRNGWQGEAAIVTGIDRGSLAMAAKAAQSWLEQAKAAGDPVEVLRAHAAIASLAVTSGRQDARQRLKEMLAAADAGAQAADEYYPPASTEVRLFAGLLSAWMEDAAGVASALESSRDSSAVRDFPTVAQLQQVVLAEQERLAGDPRAAASRLRPIVKRPDALVVAHWSLMRAERDAGSTDAARAQEQWLASHRGRIFVESSTTEVLRFVNVAIPAGAGAR